MDLANSLSKLQSIAQDSSNIATDPVSFPLTSSNRFTNNSVKLSIKVARIEKVTIEDLELDFTIPGYDIELRVRHKLEMCFFMYAQPPFNRKMVETYL